MKNKPVLNVLYTNIGRGHPYYLDGIVRKLRTKFVDSIDLNVVNVFAISRGVPLRLWRAVRWLYRFGSQGGPVGRLYESIRKGRRAESQGLIEKQMGRSIRRYLTTQRHPTLAAHPILIPMISDLVPAYYQHGEIAVPDEAVVKGAVKVFVPLDECRKKFCRSGVDENCIMVSGLCIEDELVQNAEEHFNNRISRLKGGYTLTGGFFSSGAEPRRHIRKIISAVESVAKSRQKAIVFCRENGELQKAITRDLRIPTYSCSGNFEKIANSEEVISVSFRNREEEDALTAGLFERLDYFVAPSHERTNWAVGLGVPMFVLHPIIGTFSPLNRDFLLREGVAVDIDSDRKASEFGSFLLKLRENGTLAEMADRGFNKYNINGFERITETLAKELTKNQISC